MVRKIRCVIRDNFLQLYEQGSDRFRFQFLSTFCFLVLDFIVTASEVK